MVKCIQLLLVAVFSLNLVACANLVRPNFSETLAELRPGQYRIDPEHAYIHFKVEHLNLSYVVGRFNQVDATLDFDPNNLAALQLDGRIQLASIDMNNSSLENRLRGAGWFDVEQYPEASFTTTAVDADSSGNGFVVTGDFSLHGITQPLSLQAEFNGGADNLLTGKYTLGFSANGKFNRSDFGIDGLAALVGDEISIEIHAEFQRNP